MDIFEFIEDGKPGAMQRFGDAVSGPLKALDGDAAHKLADCLNMSITDLMSILDAPDALEKHFKPEIIEGCGTAFRLDLRKCFKKSEKLTPDKKTELQRHLAQWGAHLVAGCTATMPTDADIVDLFLLTHALQQLESA